MIARTILDAARRAHAKHPVLTAEEIAHAIACAYGIPMERLAAAEAEIVAALREEAS